MAATGVFRIPREFKDEDRWFRYFNKKQAATLVVAGLVDYRLIMTGAAHGITIPAIVAAILLTLVTGGLVMIHLPVDVMFLTGGGITLDQWIFRVLLRKSKRVIYTKNVQERDC